jgi:uncharacterized protein (TIGR02145 family)
MKGFNSFLVYTFLLILIFPSIGLSEGTKQLMPDSASNKTCKILIANGNVSGQRDPFALYNGNSDYRLYIHISDSSKEKIYFGLGTSSGSAVTWRIHKPDGTVIWSGTTPVSSSPSGFIKYYKQAYLGPTKLSPSGYPANVVIPVVNGDYFMTFQVSNADSRMFEKFDITVIDTTTNTAKNGRVFSRAWQLSTFEPTDHGFFGKLFPYTNDGIVSQFDPNGFLGRWFTVSCNESGCYKIDALHNAQQARRSTNGWHNYPQYKIFLNDPDTTVYPSGTIGQMIPDSLQVISNCTDGTIEFIILTTAKGTIEITLELSSLGAPYVNRILVESTNGGKDTITWDGKDGNGVSVNSGASFLFTLRFYNGLTHLPLWDVENNPNGFKVTLVRPQGVPVIPDPEFFWDDSEVGGTTLINPPGCTSTPTTGCHSWSGDWGDVKTINTWWFVVSTTTTPVYITYKKGPQNLGAITGPSQVCQGQTVQYSVGNDPYSLQYDWIWPGGFGTTYVPAITIYFPPNATPGPGQIKVNGVNNDCGAGPVSIKSMIINQLPVADFIADTACIGSPTTFTDISLPYAASIISWTWDFGDASPASNLQNPVHTYSNFGIYTVVLTVTNSNGCVDDVSKQILVSSSPGAEFFNTSPNCVGSPVCYTDMSYAFFGYIVKWKWEFGDGSSQTVWFPNGPSVCHTFVDAALAHIVRLTVTSSTGCSHFIEHMVSSVPLPIADFDFSTIRCAGQLVQFGDLSQTNGGGQVTSWLWNFGDPSSGGNNTSTLQNPAHIFMTSGTYNVSLIISNASNCIDTVVKSIIINQIPLLINSPQSKQICNNTNTNIPLISDVTGALFTWTATGSSLLVSGYANSTNPANLINQTLVNSGFTTETVTYHITPHANGCVGPVTNYFVTVYPSPNLSNNPLNKTQCNNTTTNLTLTSNVTGTLFTWTCTPSSANVSGFTNSTTPTTLINQTLINTGYNNETVSYHLTPHANGCNGLVTDYVVTVYPVPDLSNNPLTMQVCNNTPTNQTLTSHVAGTLFTWTATGSSPLVSGYSDNAIPTVSLNQTLVNSGLNAEYVTYHITPHTNGCNGPVTDYVVTVVSSPDVYFNPPAQTVCSQQISSIQVLSHVPGTTFTWTASASSPNLSGYSNSAGNMIAQTVTNSGITVETVTYTVYPTAWGCPPGAPQNVVLSVNPKPAVTNPVTTFQQCSAAITNIVLQSSVPGSSYTWTASGSSLLVSGFSAGAGNKIQQTLINTGFNIETVTYNVTPSANSCPGDPKSFTVNVFPVPDVYFTPPSQTICPLQTSNITNNSHVSGATYSWTASGSSVLVTGYSAGSGNMIQQPLNNTGYNIETVTYQIAPAANGCPGISSNVVVTVDPAPVVSFTLCVDPVTTTDAQPIKLKGGNPVNGTYSGRGVSSAILYPALAGVGMDTIYYAYTNTYGCSRNNFLVISIISPLPFNCGSSITDPRDNKQYPTVQIGTQCWMAANLDYGQQLSSSLTQRDNCLVEKYCYNDNPGNCVSSGGLYQWDELMKYDNSPAIQGLCPPGWHIPAENEWNTLFSFYISNGFAGSPLKSTGYSGFNAYLDGARFKNVNWNFLNFATFFWSSTSHGPYKAWVHGMNDYNPSVSFYPSSRSNAFQVRCIKD